MIAIRIIHKNLFKTDLKQGDYRNNLSKFSIIVQYKPAFVQWK